MMIFNVIVLQLDVLLHLTQLGGKLRLARASEVLTR